MLLKQGTVADTRTPSWQWIPGGRDAALGWGALGGSEKSSQKSQNTSLSNGLSYAVLSSPGSQTDNCYGGHKGAVPLISVLNTLMSRSCESLLTGSGRLIFFDEIFFMLL